MKKPLIIGIIFVVIIVLCLFCIGFASFFYYKNSGSGDVIKENRVVGNFAKISLDGRGELIIQQGDKSELSIEAEDNIVKRIKTDVKDNELNISYKRILFSPFGGMVFPKEDIKFFVTVKDLKQVVINGTGELSSDYLDIDNLVIKIDGAGKVRFEEVYANKLEMDIDGAGDAVIEGEITVQDIKINGAGKYNAINLVSRDCEISIDGAGEAAVYVTEDLKAKIDGAGKLTYDGSPDNIDKDISGLGEIIER